MTFIEKMLCKVFPFVDIYRDGTKDIYLRRFFIYPRNKDFSKNKSKGRIYLHKFYRGDEDPHLHDHPWNFVSLILTRGYWEETPANQPGRDESGTIRNGRLTVHTRDNEWFFRTFYRRFSILHRPAAWKHRVILKDTKPVWTIVRTGVKERSWGFWLKEKFCPWRRYDNGVCWCEEGNKGQMLTGQGVEGISS